MSKYFATWSKFNKKKVYFNTISPAGIEDNQEKKFKLNYKKIYKAPMLKTSSLKNIVNQLLLKKINGKNFIITGGAKI
jgi:hypothetical protein